MPRLVGKQSNEGASLILLLLIAIGIAGSMEYAGVINLVPQFGRDYVDEPGPVEGDGQFGLSQDQSPDNNQPDSQLNQQPSNQLNQNQLNQTQPNQMVQPVQPAQPSGQLGGTSNTLPSDATSSPSPVQ